MMMKPKVLPGLAGGHARLALVLQMVFFLPPICGSLGREVGGSGRGWCGLVSHLSSGPLPHRGRIPLHHQEGAGGDMATSANLAGAPCSCSPHWGWHSTGALLRP